MVIILAHETKDTIPSSNFASWFRRAEALLPTLWSHTRTRFGVVSAQKFEDVFEWVTSHLIVIVRTLS